MALNIRSNRKWYLGIVAILSVVSVASVMTVSRAGSNAARNLLIERSGAQVLTTTQLTDFVVREKLVAYWLGPISGSGYTIVANDSRRVTISYLSSGLGIDEPFQRNLVIVTMGYGRNRGAILSDESEINNAKDATVTGNTFSYDRSFADHMTVQMKVSAHQVQVIYPQTRTPLSMETDAEGLVKIG